MTEQTENSEQEGGTGVGQLTLRASMGRIVIVQDELGRHHPAIVVHVHEDNTIDAQSFRADNRAHPLEGLGELADEEIALAHGGRHRVGWFWPRR